MKTPCLYLLILLAACFSASAQTAQYGLGSPTLSEIFYDSKFDPSDGGIIHVGHVVNTGTGNDILMVKTNSSNQIVWQKVFVNSGTGDELFNVIVAANGDYLMCGNLMQAGKYRGVVFRVNSTNGNVIWTVTSSPTASTNGDIFWKLCETASGNIAVAGTYDYLPNVAQGMITLLSSAGTLIWSKVSQFNGSDQTFAVNQLPGSGNLVIGTGYNAGTDYNLSIMELTEATGTQVAQNYYDINVNLPGALLANSIWPSEIVIRNGSVIFNCAVFHNFTGDSYPATFVYDQTTKAFSGYITYHPGAVTGVGYRIYPMSATDFFVGYSSSTAAASFLSRVTNGAMVFDRKIDNTSPHVVGLDVSTNNKILLSGAYDVGATTDAYYLQSDLTFPLSTTPCSISTANTISIIPSNLPPTAGNPIVFNPVLSTTTIAVSNNNTAYTVNAICGCPAIAVSSQPASTTVCSGSNATFSVTASNNTTYQWQVSTDGGGVWTDITNGGVYSGATSATLTITGATLGMNNYQYRCVLTSSCSNLNSNAAILTVTNSLAPGVSIAASANPVCQGTPVTFTATPVNGGSSPIYQWKKNAAVAGGNSATYTDNALLNGDVITCTLTSSFPCATTPTANSNSITMTVNPPVTPTVSIAASNTSICQGTPVTFTASIANGGAAPVYQWKKNGSSVGTNSAAYTDNALANGDVIQCILTSNANCAINNPATSNSIMMTVAANVTPQISIIASSNPVCPGTPVTFTAIINNGGPAPVYQWKKNGSNVGANVSTYTDNALANGDVVNCVLTSNANCTTSSNANSNNIVMVIIPPSPPQIVISANPNPFCIGSAVTFTAIYFNGGTNPGFQWKKNGSNVGTSSSTFVTGNLANGDVITCVLTSSSACATPPTATSNSITMSAGASAGPGMRYPVKYASAVQPLQLSARNLGGYSYQWLPDIGLNDNTFMNPIFRYNHNVEYAIHIALTSGCETVDTQQVIIQTVTEIYVPSAFRPNGTNIRLYPILVGVSKINNFRVYNRWGELVFITNSANPADGWDGTFKGKEQPTGTFVWTVDGIDINGEEVKRSGSSILIR